MAYEKVLLIRDSREHEGYGYNWGEDDWTKGTKIDALSVGDYSIAGLEHLIFVDRKQTVSELAKNITEPRFLRLIEKAKKFKYRFLICEFSMDDIAKYPVGSEIPPKMWKAIRIRPKFIKIWLTKIAIEYGIQIILAGNTKEAEDICYNILKTIHKLESKNV